MLLHRLRQVQQPQQVRGGAARAADGRRRLLVREVELADQALHALRFLERVQVLALDVLDQRHRQRRRVRNLLDEHRDFGEAGHLRRAKAALARDDLVAIGSDRAHEDRLHHALGADRVREFGERLRVHARARLVLARLQARDRQGTSARRRAPERPADPRRAASRGLARALSVVSSSRLPLPRRPAATVRAAVPESELRSCAGRRRVARAGLRVQRGHIVAMRWIISAPKARYACAPLELRSYTTPGRP